MPPPPKITISLATEQDASSLASVMTAAFAASDAAYPLIWGLAAEGTHDMVAEKGLFSPVQQEGRVTFKAVEDGSGMLVGIATWGMPVERKDGEGEKKKSEGGLPTIPGVNGELWGEKVGGTRRYAERDVDGKRDLLLTFLFVHPDFQRRGIGSLLLGWGKEKADELQRKIWLTSTPQARAVYEKNGWRVVESHQVDLSKYGGEGIYVRYWMLRPPA